MEATQLKSIIQRTKTNCVYYHENEKETIIIITSRKYPERERGEDPEIERKTLSSK